MPRAPRPSGASSTASPPSPSAAVVFLRERPELRREIGFTSACSPSQSTCHRLLSKLDIASLRDALGLWLSRLAKRRGAKVASL